jgi:CDGSH-type Zn-finger protein
MTTSNQPIVANLKEGQEYYYCTCGKSKNQPFCDDISHDGTGFKPLAFVAEKSGDEYLCSCKQTKSAPFCDGSHKNI